MSFSLKLQKNTKYGNGMEMSMTLSWMEFQQMFLKVIVVVLGIVSDAHYWKWLTNNTLLLNTFLLSFIKTWLLCKWIWNV